MGLLRPVLLAGILFSSVFAGEVQPPAFRTKFPKEPLSGTPVLVAVRVAAPPRMTGKVDDDPVWQEVAKRGGATRGAWVQLGTRQVTSRQTVAYACYDAKGLYLGFVCEEPELQNMRAEGKVAGTLDRATDDFIEAVLEVGGLNGEGKTYSFRANQRAGAAAWGLAHVAKDAVSPEFTYKGALGFNRWMLEMSIPFASLRQWQNSKGLPTPSRGDVLGIKLARYGAVQADPKNRMIATFNSDIAFPMLYLCGVNGRLYFDSENILSDGDFEPPLSESQWKTNGIVKQTGTAIELQAGAEVSQTVELRPGSFYRLDAEFAGAGNVVALLNGTSLKPEGSALAAFLATENHKTAKLAINATQPSVLRGIVLRNQPGEEPPGPLCLTNNYHTPSRNLSSLAPDAPLGRYQYVELDYLGNIIGDLNPAIPVKHWAVNYEGRVEDLGGRSGWITFNKGSLTGRPEPVFWQVDNPKDSAAFGRVVHTIDVDLGAPYFVQGLDVLWPAPNIENLEIWGKEKEADEWILLHASDGEFVNPAQRNGDYRGYESVRHLDSVIRFLRWRGSPARGDHKPPQLSGIQEFWIWGEPPGNRHGLTPFKPWVPNTAAAPVAWSTSTPDREGCQIVPRPKEMKLTGGNFILGKNTRIVAQDAPAVLRTATLIQEEIERLYAFRAPIEKETASTQLSSNFIYIGQSDAGGAADSLSRRNETLAHSASHGPQGYALSVTKDCAVVLGADSDGMYWGVQSLMLALRWRNEPNESASGPSIPCMQIVDWPDTLERGLFNTKGYAAIISFPETEIYRARRMMQLLSRFKFNTVYVQVNDHDGGPPDAGHPADPGLGKPGFMPGWSEGTFTRLCKEVRENYHIELRPSLMRWEQTWWHDAAVSAGTTDIIESDPDEAAADLGWCMNLCPVDPASYLPVFHRMDVMLDRFDHPNSVWLGAQVYGRLDRGARWAVCRKCMRSGLNTDQLYALFLSRTAEHLRTLNTNALLESTYLSFADTGVNEKDLTGLNFHDVPPGLSIALPAQSKDEEFIKRLQQSLDPAHTANGPAAWPARERYVVGPYTESEVLFSLAGGSFMANPGGVAEKMTLSASIDYIWNCRSNPESAIDYEELGKYLRGWWMGIDFPSWRRGIRPHFVPLNLRSVANHVSHATGTEAALPGRTPEVDLRYMPKGRQTFGGIDFDIIDPDQNGGKGILMLGRPLKSVLPEVARTIAQQCAPIPVGKRLASLAFLGGRWNSSVNTLHWSKGWLRPSCRVIYKDDTYLVVDAFQFPHEGGCSDLWNKLDTPGINYRSGWVGNTPTGASVGLPVVEWVNPYPEKMIRCIDFFVPDLNERQNNLCEFFVAISGIEASGFDLVRWRNRPDRALPIPLPNVSMPEGTVWAYSDMDFTNKTSGAIPISSLPREKCPQFTLSENTALARVLDNAVVAYSTKGFATFGMTIVFPDAQKLARIDVTGPYQQFDSIASFTARTQKVDLTVELSLDGKEWKTAAHFNGINSDWDYLGVDVSKVSLRGIRFTASGASYRDGYHPTQNWGGLFTHVTGCPHFSWRLVGPK